MKFNFGKILKTGLLLPALGIIVAASAGCNEKSASLPGPLTPVSFENVRLEDDFWLPRLQIQKDTLVPFSLGKTEDVVENLRRVGDYLKTGKKQKLLDLPRYVSSDLFKVMEGAAYLLILEKDSALENRMDGIIDIIADSQCPDGYLYELFSVDPSMRELRWGAGDRPYSFVIHSHELYVMGHMYEAAVAYFRATGKRKWLDVAEKNARHINRVFFEGDPNYNDGKPVNQAPGHQEIELALVKMWHATGNDLYLDMAKKFIDIRGVSFIPDGEGIMSGEYSQQHMPAREQRSAEGHAVRAMYLYSGMADIMGATGDTTLRPALEAIWCDIVDKKMHINGGLGAVPGIEGFGPEYELPNKNTYDETCAAVGNVFFNYRMFLATGDPKYVDVAEVALYNNVLAGVNLDGNKFFYVNVLEADGKKAFNHGRAGRSPWFGTACCPSNLARLIPQVAGMAYSYNKDGIYCGLYAGCSTSVPLERGNVGIRQTTGYPFNGTVELTVSPENEDSEFSLNLRIPTWCRNSFVPGKLYSYEDDLKVVPEVFINGIKEKVNTENGYASIRRKWSKDDVVRLELPMKVRYSIADQRVEADSNRVCITRGPLLYCAEQPDNRFGASMYVIDHIGEQGTVEKFSDGPLKGIDFISLKEAAVDNDSIAEADLTLIPYYAWNNRGDNMSMNVWFGKDAATVRKSIVRPVGNVIHVDASYTNSSDDVLAVADGISPESSSDGSISRWTSWPLKGRKQYVDIILKEKQPIESISVYWYDDARGVQIPENWDAEYRIDGEWHKFRLYNTETYGTEKDQFNMIHPAAPISADAIRINMTPKNDTTVGILEVVIE